MQHEIEDSGRVVARRIFFIQIALIVTLLALVLVGSWIETSTGWSLGFFWFGFFSGCIGGTVGLQTRLRGDAETLRAIAQSRVDTLIPVLYGGIMATVAYVLFMSGIVAGELFPIFSSSLPASQSPGIDDYIGTRPDTITDVGKLLVWSFIAGYSERFISGLLGQLERKPE